MIVVADGRATISATKNLKEKKWINLNQENSHVTLNIKKRMMRERKNQYVRCSCISTSRLNIVDFPFINIQNTLIYTKQLN